MTSAAPGHEPAATSLRDEPTASALVERARSLERDALARLGAAAGDRSLCALSRDGRPHPAAKFHEGAVAALAEARRALGAAPPEASAAWVIEGVRAGWLARHDRLPDAAAWTAYRAGGLDALEPLLRPPADEQPRAPWTVGLPDAVRLPQAGSPAAAADAAARTTALGPQPIAVADAARPWGAAPAATDDGGSRRVLRRRAVAAAALWPGLLMVLALAGGGWTWQLPWAAIVPLVALGGAVTLSTYAPRPGSGRRLEIGCTPCAAVSALTVVLAAWLLHFSPHEPVAAAGALAAVGFGLLQRLTKSGTACPA